MAEALIMLGEERHFLDDGWSRRAVPPDGPPPRKLSVGCFWSLSCLLKRCECNLVPKCVLYWVSLPRV
jgi:hypothetical protein